MQRNVTNVSGNIVDVANAEIYPGTIKISNSRIIEIIRNRKTSDIYITPGFVDSHVHIESSMLTPSEFARAAVVHGTVAVVSDPHEIANVMGIEGVKYMIEDGKASPMKFYFSAPSCVPATPFETSGAVLDNEKVEELLKLDEIKYLGEVMNFPGVLNDDPDIMEKIHCAKKYGKLIDGHAPGLRGADLEKYANAGISTNHECLTPDETLEDLQSGIRVQIRKGSAADIFENCLPIIEKHYNFLMFCSDDKHPDDLVRGYLNEMVKASINHGIDIIKVFKVASANPILHYGLDVGLLRVGDYADFLEIDNLKNFNILKTYINGEIVARDQNSLIPRRQPVIINNFKTGKKNVTDFIFPCSTDTIDVIAAIDGQVITDRLVVKPKVKNGNAVSDVERDILKITVVNRYKDTRPAVGFINNFGLKEGAMASSVAHDSHNIVAVGVNDEELCKAVNRIIEEQGGICAVSGNKEIILPLPIAGIMSNEDYLTVARKYTKVDEMAKSIGSTLRSPFMTLSFMSLPVIPKLKLTDRGLFNVEKFEYLKPISVF
jgi:adenine deaminase